MMENRAVGPNLKTYFYYTNSMAEQKDVKGIIIIATGIEATGSVYDEIGDYLDQKGYAMYAIDEWGYGKTGKLVKNNYKNWDAQSSHFAAYNIHALSVLAKSKHPDAPVYLIGNDFGAMLSLYLIKEFPEVIDKVVTIGWGTPRMQDYGFLFTSWLRKVFFYDKSVSKIAHFSKNKRLAIHFERSDKYSWLSSDLEQVKKIRNAGYIDEAGTVGHYFHYYRRKVKTPLYTRLKKCDRKTPMLFMSGDSDLLTLKGRKTKALERYYKNKKFNNVTSMIVPGRHELLFEKNRFENIDIILNWLDGANNVANKQEVKNDSNYHPVKVVEKKEIKIQEEINQKEEVKVIEYVSKEEATSNSRVYQEFQEADDDLLLNTNKEDK